MKKVLIVLIIAFLYGCSKDNPEVKSPNIIGNIYSGFVDYRVFSLGGNSSNNKAYKFMSSSNVVIIKFIDNTYMPSVLHLPIYELTSKTESSYTLNFPDLTIGTNVLDRFNPEADFITNVAAAMKKVDMNSELGLFLNSIK